jgi:hypothetical protein
MSNTSVKTPRMAAPSYQSPITSTPVSNNQGTKRRQIIAELQSDYGISLSQDRFRWYITLFSHGIPHMEKFPTWDALDFILDDNVELFAYFIYGLNAFKNYKAQENHGRR